MTFVLYFYAIYDENNGTAHGGHFPDPYKFRLSYQTYHFETVSFSTLERSLFILFTTPITVGSDCTNNYTYHKFYCFTVDICSFILTYD